WLARVALIFQIVVLAWRLPPAGRGPARLWWVMLAIGGVALLTLSLSSHAAAEPAAAIAVPLDWLHIAATVAWIGGLIPLAFAIRAARRHAEPALPLALLVPRFSWLSAPCVAILTLTGIYNYILHVDRLDLLAATTYGRALLIKLGLFGVLLLLGGLNLFLLSRRLRASGGGPAHALARSVAIEIVVGALVLLAVGAMTSVAPSKAAWEQHEQQGIAQSAQLGDVDLTLRIAPAQIGDNEFAVDVSDRRPGAAAATTRVLLLFDMQGMQMGKLQTEAKPAGAERYLTRGNFTTMGGRWHVEVVLRRAGFDDVRHTFQVDITRAPAT
ncbi:MAG TPA: CopD family protein, partial [Roseiflexaceae bacterium]